MHILDKWYQTASWIRTSQLGQDVVEGQQLFLGFWKHVSYISVQVRQLVSVHV